MDKNYWLALSLSMLILLGYPFLLQKFAPRRLATQPGGPPSPAAANLPGLPALPRAAKAESLTFENALYRAKISSRGAAITQLIYKGEAGRSGIDHILFYQARRGEPGNFATGFLREDKTDPARAVFRTDGRDTRGVTLSFESPGDYRLRKHYLFGDKQPAVVLELAVENLSAREKVFPLEIFAGLNVEFDPRVTARDFEAVAAQEKIRYANFMKLSKRPFALTGPMPWAGLLRKYFALLVWPEEKIVSYEAAAEKGRMSARLRLEPVRVGPGQKAERRVLIYAGPQRYETLKGFGAGFEDLFSRGFFGLFKLWLLMALKFFNRFTQNYGWSIILLTFGLKIAFAPLTHMSYDSMRKMQALQPRLKSLQERYKNDAAKLNKEMMELYKRNRVNPMGGCLPMLLQIPIFIAFYQVLNETIELKGAPFIYWIRDLAEPDKLYHFPVALPFLGDSLNLLPLLMLGSMFWQQKLTPSAGATPEQTKMMSWMPLIFGLLFYKMPSGLVLYWFLNNVLTILHQLVIKRMGDFVLHHEDRD